MGWIPTMGGIIALSAFTQLARAGEAPRTDELGLPLVAEAPVDERPVEARPPDAPVPEAPPSAEAPPEPRGARVIWAAPGQAPPRPRLALPAEGAPTLPRPRRFRLRNVRWVVGLDRVSSLAGYRSTADDGADIVTTGVDASIVGQSNQDAFTPLVLPRLSLDRRWGNGFSLGLVFSYAARGGRQSSDDSVVDLPSSRSALLGARAGWMMPFGGNVAFWLRGGPTWAMRSSSELTSEPGELRTVSARHWALSLEPQLVIMPLRHVGLSIGAAVDLGFDGESRVAYVGGPQPYLSRMHESVSTYGCTAGLFALF